jgi:hypothetical protein
MWYIFKVNMVHKKLIIDKSFGFINCACLQEKWSCFEETLQFWKTICFCYNKQTSPRVINHVALPFTWHIS